VDVSDADDMEAPLSLELVDPEVIAPEDIDLEDIAPWATCFFLFPAGHVVAGGHRVTFGHFAAR
jgi:hypothetical protein